MTRLLAIDPSLQSLGFAYGAPGGTEVVGMVKPKKLSGAKRLAYLRDSVRDIMALSEPTLVVYEGYSMGSRHGRAFDIGELGGVLKLLFFDAGVDILLVPPTSLKLFATGKGNSDKPAMIAAMSEARGEKFSSSDEADAYALFCFGTAYLLPRHRPRDARHYKHKALSGCEFVNNTRA